VIATGACPSSARTRFCFKFQRIPCPQGHTHRHIHDRTGTTATRITTASVTHQRNAAGNLQSGGLYHYHSRGRLQSSQTGQGPDVPTTCYAHNALGQRVFKIDPLFAAASGKGGALDEEEDSGLMQTLVKSFTKSMPTLFHCFRNILPCNLNPAWMPRFLNQPWFISST
jgi:hypothetical protein